jgi:hypothetical protein
MQSRLTDNPGTAFPPHRDPNPFMRSMTTSVDHSYVHHTLLRVGCSLACSCCSITCCPNPAHPGSAYKLQRRPETPYATPNKRGIAFCVETIVDLLKDDRPGSVGDIVCQFLVRWAGSGTSQPICGRLSTNAAFTIRGKARLRLGFLLLAMLVHVSVYMTCASRTALCGSLNPACFPGRLGGSRRVNHAFGDASVKFQPGLTA